MRFALLLRALLLGPSLIVALEACGGSSSSTAETSNVGSTGGDAGRGGGTGGGGEGGAGGASEGGAGGAGGQAGAPAGAGGAAAGGGSGSGGQPSGGQAGASGGAGGAVVTTCPSKAGPIFIQVPNPSGGTMCIDETEVTREQYQVFLASSPSTAGQPGACASNGSYQINAQCAAKATVCTGSGCPVTCIDWCDARAYCAWAGKRLCGKHGGGAVPPNDLAKPDVSQWMNACSGGLGQFAEKNMYPYGNTFDPLGCDTADATKCDPLKTCKAKPVKSHPGCVTSGDYAGVFDLSGKAWEWEDNCDASGNCRVRGGSAYSVGVANACGYFSDPLPRLTPFDSVGFRCCN